MEKRKIVIIGFGRFGKLLAKILKPYGEIFVIEKDRAIVKGFKQIELKDLKEVDWIFLAVPISSLENILNDIGSYLKEGSIVMDVCSVKIYPARILKKYLPEKVQIMGTHPMFGPDSAKNGLNGLQIVLCPIRISKQNLLAIKKILKDLKLKIIEISPEEHDRQGAMNLSLVHFLGRGLGKIGMKDQQIKTLGFQRLLAVNETVNNDTWQLFVDMQKFNPYAKKVRKEFIKALEWLDNKID